MELHGQSGSPDETEPLLASLTESRLSRRDLLRKGVYGAVGVSGLALGGSLLAACGGTSNSAASSAAIKKLGVARAGQSLNFRTVKLGYGGGGCEAPLYAAYNQGFFKKYGLDVQLNKVPANSTATDAVSSGKLDGAPGILFQWLKPIEQGVNIRLTGGIHKGCLRFIASKRSGITELSQLKGKTVATDAIGGSAMAFFSVDLAKAGINPSKDINWVAYQPGLLSKVLQKGEAPALAASDPYAWLALRAGDAIEIDSNMSQTHKNEYCCAVALNSKLIEDHPEVAQAITSAWFEGSAWVGHNITRAAHIETAGGYVPIPQHEAADLLAGYGWTPGTNDFYNQLLQGAKNFKSTGYLDPSTNPAALAKGAFVDVRPAIPNNVVA
jgi:NitT/TauT family transport system substrate-binding protein